MNFKGNFLALAKIFSSCIQFFIPRSFGPFFQVLVVISHTANLTILNSIPNEKLSSISIASRSFQWHIVSLYFFIFSQKFDTFVKLQFSNCFSLENVWDSFFYIISLMRMNLSLGPFFHPTFYLVP